MNTIYHIENLHHYRHPSLIDLLLPNFLLSETFWVAVSSIVAASVLIYTLRKDGIERMAAIENIKRALYFEMLTNINMLFTKEVERIPVFEVIHSVRKDFAIHIIDQELFFEIQDLYVELDYYKVIIEEYWIKPEMKYRNPGEIIQEKQLLVANAFIEFFGMDKIIKNETETADQARDRAIAIKENNIKKWESDLNKKIYRLF